MIVSSPVPLPAAAPSLSEAISGLLVVVPAFNEEGRVGNVVLDLLETMPGVNVVVVDDGSEDATASEAASRGASVITLAINIGYGAAIQTGFKYGVRRGYTTIACIDADGQHQAKYLPAMLEHLRDSDADVVIGSRFLDRDGHYRPSRARKAGISLFASLASLLIRQNVTDPTSGLQVMTSDVAQFFCSDVYPPDYPDADILILLHRTGFRIAEVPVQMRPSPGKSMHSGHRSFYYVYKMLLSILVAALRPGVKS
jgi:hypothetical protein